MITAAAALFCWATNVSAEQVTLKALGAAVVLPPQWIVTQGGDSIRRWAAFKPSKDADANNALRCRIDKNLLPERFRNMTQAQINELQARAPLSAQKFAEQLQMDGVLPTIVENGDGMIDTSYASWAITTTSETKGTTTAYYKSKIALPQTPGYVVPLLAYTELAQAMNQTRRRLRDGMRPKADTEYTYKNMPQTFTQAEFKIDVADKWNVYPSLEPGTLMLQSKQEDASLLITSQMIEIAIDEAQGIADANIRSRIEASQDALPKPATRRRIDCSAFKWRCPGDVLFRRGS
ncbi:unnamed protein product [Brugia timori]|uniref:Signal peptide protein n=1 Tax=Brugia timori TaxID=42155 RepID=A0A0R3Q7M4_9BILA|nr:unnamed protein product [Brugia timori]